jgi:hypothetical protein
LRPTAYISALLFNVLSAKSARPGGGATGPYSY